VYPKTRQERWTAAKEDGNAQAPSGAKQTRSGVTPPSVEDHPPVTGRTVECERRESWLGRRLWEHMNYTKKEDVLGKKRTFGVLGKKPWPWDGSGESAWGKVRRKGPETSASIRLGEKMRKTRRGTGH